MFRNWPDRPQPKPRKPFVASGEFWLGVATVLVILALAVGFGQRLFGA